MEKCFIVLLSALLLSSCIVTSGEIDESQLQYTERVTTYIPRETTPTTTTTAAETQTDDFDIYETGGIMYQVPKSWTPVNTGKDETSYRKFKASDFCFSVQYFPKNYFNLSDDETQLINDYEKYFKSVTVSNLSLYQVNGMDCIYTVCNEKSDNHLTLKLACQASKGIVYFNFFDSEDIDKLDNALSSFSETISGNKTFPNIKASETTTTTKNTTTTTTTTITAEETKTEKTTTEVTTVYEIGHANALKAAMNYLSFMPFSHSGLIKQLEYEGYSHADAQYAADNCGADWKLQAAEKAKEYMEIMSFSRDGLIKQLEYEGYTHEQAEYGASAVGY